MRPEGAVRVVAQVGKQTVGREVWLQLQILPFETSQLWLIDLGIRNI